MSRKLWLSTATVVVALLAVFATSAVAKSGQRPVGAVGGTMNVDFSTDVDYTDPALDYLSTGWEIEYSTCLKLMNYPDANGPKGSQLVPEAAAGFPKVSNSGKTYDFNVKAGFTKFSNGAARHRRELQGCVRPRRGPEDAVAGRPVLLGHRRLVTSRRSPV